MKNYKSILLALVLIILAGIGTSCKQKEEVLPTETETSTAVEITEESTEEAETKDTTIIPEDGKVTVYIGNDDASGLDAVEVEANQLTPEILVEQLIKNHVLEEGTKVISFEIDGSLGTLNLTKVPVYGTAGEAVMLGSIGNTFIEAYQVEKIRLLVNGNNYESGHIIYGDEDYLYYRAE